MKFGHRAAGLGQQAQDFHGLVGGAQDSGPSQRPFQHQLGRAQGLQRTVAAGHLRQRQAHLQRLLVKLGLVQRGGCIAQRAARRAAQQGQAFGHQAL